MKSYLFLLMPTGTVALAQAALTDYYRPGGLNNRDLSQIWRLGSLRIKVLAR